MDTTAMDTTAEQSTENTPYPDSVWAEVVSVVAEAEAEVVRARDIKRKADKAYAEALHRREEVQVERDRMIVTDPRTPTEISYLADLGRARCSQIRARFAARREDPRSG